MKLARCSWGRGRPLFLVPGWGMPAAALAPLARALPGWELTAVDLPGQGASPDVGYDARSLADALLAAAPPGALWLGWSLGVPLALEAALRQAPVGLCLVAGTPRFAATAGWAGVAPEALADMRRELETDSGRVWRGFLGLLASRGEGSRAAARRLLQQPAPPGIVGLASGLRVLAEVDLRQRLHAVGVPVQWLGGAADPLVPVPALRAAAEAMPAATSEIGEGIGHLAPLTHPLWVARGVQLLRERLE